MGALIVLAFLAGCVTARPEAMPSDLSGTWETAAGLDTATLVLRKTGLDQCRVDWRTDGCLGGYNGTTTATVDAGRLVLNDPAVLYSDENVRSYPVVVHRRGTALVPELASSGAGYVKLQTLHPAVP